MRFCQMKGLTKEAAMRMATGAKLKVWVWAEERAMNVKPLFSPEKWKKQRMVRSRRSLIRMPKI